MAAQGQHSTALCKKYNATQCNKKQDIGVQRIWAMQSHESGTEKHQQQHKHNSNGKGPQNTAELSRAEHSRAEHSKAQQSTAEQSRAGRSPAEHSTAQRRAAQEMMLLNSHRAPKAFLKGSPEYTQ